MASHQTPEELAALAVVGHHAKLAAALREHHAGLLAAAQYGDVPKVWRLRDDLLEWLRGELLPHATAEEATLYPAAADDQRGTLLVDGMLDEHRLITSLVVELDSATSPIEAVATSRALVAIFTTHLAKENDLIVPLLVGSELVSLARLLEGMHDLVGGHAEALAERAAGAGDDSEFEGGCGCWECGCRQAAAPPADLRSAIEIERRPKESVG